MSLRASVPIVAPPATTVTPTQILVPDQVSLVCIKEPSVGKWQRGDELRWHLTLELVGIEPTILGSSLDSQRSSPRRILAGPFHVQTLKNTATIHLLSKYRFVHICAINNLPLTLLDTNSGEAIMPLPKHYATLGVGIDATVTEIKRSFNKIASQHHPDKSSDPASKDTYRQAFEAYEILRNRHKRAEYDAYFSGDVFTANGQAAPPSPQQARQAAAKAAAKAADDAQAAADAKAAKDKAEADRLAKADAEAKARKAAAKARADAKAYADAIAAANAKAAANKAAADAKAASAARIVANANQANARAAAARAAAASAKADTAKPPAPPTPNMWPSQPVPRRATAGPWRSTPTTRTVPSRPMSVPLYPVGRRHDRGAWIKIMSYVLVPCAIAIWAVISFFNQINWHPPYQAPDPLSLPRPIDRVIPTHVSLNCVGQTGQYPNEACGTTLNASSGMLSLELVGVAPATIVDLCTKGYEVKWSDNYRDSLVSYAEFVDTEAPAFTRWPCVSSSTSPKRWQEADFVPVWGADQVPKNGFTDKYVSPDTPFPWVVTWKLISPSGATVLEASYKSAVVSFIAQSN